MHRHPSVHVRLAVLVLVLGLAAFAHAQFRGREGRFPPRFPPAERTDRGFSVCRLMYESVRQEPMGMGWRTDYPYAEINLSIRLSELTRTDVSFDDYKEPSHFVVRLTDEALFECPFVVASDAGTIGLNPEEARQLQTYLLKGGFLWVDDFWGTAAWAQWEREIARVLPPDEYPITDVPASDPVFRSLFTVEHVPQITNIIFWRGVGGQTTSERGPDSADAHFRVIRDDHNRIMVVMTHNTDVADSWEREGEDPGFFYQFSPNGYAFGINVVLHAMTH
jgi:Domain of unknown function (DUF4159)